MPGGFSKRALEYVAPGVRGLLHADRNFRAREFCVDALADGRWDRRDGDQKQVMYYRVTSRAGKTETRCMGSANSFCRRVQRARSLFVGGLAECGGIPTFESWRSDRSLDRGAGAFFLGYKRLRLSEPVDLLARRRCSRQAMAHRQRPSHLLMHGSSAVAWGMQADDRQLPVIC